MKKIWLIAINIFLYSSIALSMPTFNLDCSNDSTADGQMFNERLFHYLHELKSNSGFELNNEDIQCLEFYAQQSPGNQTGGNCRSSKRTGVYDINGDCSADSMDCISNEDVMILKDYVNFSSPQDRIDAIESSIPRHRIKTRALCYSPPSNTCTFKTLADQLLNFHHNPVPGSPAVDHFDLGCAQALLNNGRIDAGSGCKSPFDTSISYSMTLTPTVKGYTITQEDVDWIQKYQSGQVAAKDLPFIEWVGKAHGCDSNNEGNPVAEVDIINLKDGDYKTWYGETIVIPLKSKLIKGETVALWNVKPTSAGSIPGTHNVVTVADLSHNPENLPLDLPVLVFDTSLALDPSSGFDTSVDTTVEFEFSVVTNKLNKQTIKKNIILTKWDWRITSERQTGNIYLDLLSDKKGSPSNAAIIDTDLVHPETNEPFDLTAAGTFHMYFHLPEPEQGANWTVLEDVRIPSGGVKTFSRHPTRVENRTRFQLFWKHAPQDAFTLKIKFSDGYSIISREVEYQKDDSSSSSDLAFKVSPEAPGDVYTHFLDWGSFKLNLIGEKGKDPYVFSINSPTPADARMQVNNVLDEFIFGNLGNADVGQTSFQLRLTDDDGAGDHIDKDISVKISDLSLRFNPRHDLAIEGKRDHFEWNVPNDTITKFELKPEVVTGTVHEWFFQNGGDGKDLPPGSSNFNSTNGTIELLMDKIKDDMIDEKEQELYSAQLTVRNTDQDVVRVYTLNFNVGPEDSFTNLVCEYVPFVYPLDSPLDPGKEICAGKDQVIRIDPATELPDSTNPLMDWRDTVELVTLNSYLNPRTLSGDHSFCHVDERQDLKTVILASQPTELNHSDETNAELQASLAQKTKDMYSTNVFYRGPQAAGAMGAAYFGSNHCNKMLLKYNKYSRYDRLSDVDISLSALQYDTPRESVGESLEIKEKSSDDPIHLPGTRTEETQTTKTFDQSSRLQYEKN